MADNNNTSSNITPASTNNNQAAGNNNNTNSATNSGWVTVNTSDSAIAQRMNIMKGNVDEFSVKNGK